MDYKKNNVSLAVARMLAPNLVRKVENFVNKYGCDNDVIKLIKNASDEVKDKLTKLHDVDLKDEVEALKKIYPAYLTDLNLNTKYEVMGNLIRFIIWHLDGRAEFDDYKYSNRYRRHMRDNPEVDVVIIKGKREVSYIFSPRLREFAKLINLNDIDIEGINCSICRTCDIESYIKRLHIVGADAIDVIDMSML